MAFGRTFLYHKTCPAGRIFDQEAEFLVHRAAGWVEAPWLIDEPAPVVASPEPVQEAEPDKVKATTTIAPKKPGRPSKKVKKGK